MAGGVDCAELDAADTGPNMGGRSSIVDGKRVLTPCYKDDDERLNLHAYWYLGLSLTS